MAWQKMPIPNELVVVYKHMIHIVKYQRSRVLLLKRVSLQEVLAATMKYFSSLKAGRLRTRETGTRIRSIERI